MDSPIKKGTAKGGLERGTVVNVIVGIFSATVLCYIGSFMMNKENNEEAANKLFENFMNWRFQDSPEFATCTGIHTWDSKLEHHSIKSFTIRRKICEDFLGMANKLSKDAVGVTLANLKLLQLELNTEITGLKYYGHAPPINYFEGPQSELLQLLSYMRKETVTDFEKMISRYQNFLTQADEMIELMTESVALKTTNHASSMAGVLDQLRALQVPVENSEFYKPFLSLPESIPLDEQIKLQNKAKETISIFLLPAFEKLANFLENIYIPACRVDIAATSLPDGKNYYKACLKFHLSIDMTPEEVHQLGLDEVDRISIRMRQIIKDLKLDLTIQEFSAKIREDPKFFYTEKKNLIEDYKNIVHNEIMPVIDNIFESIPKAELNITALPESQSGGPLAFYLAGSLDGKRAGVFYVNVGNLKHAPKYEMMSLALHEGLPGHHLQLSFVSEQADFPRFRRALEDRKYYSVPAHFPAHTAYVEGWGLYSEYLGEELGLYHDPYSLFGRLSQEIFRACRLVVDTGIHAFGWSKERAIQYMLDHSAATRGSTEKEVNRYIMWPGQACAYKVGEIKIKSLRKQAEAQLGDKFSIKEFHQLVLESMGPLSFLEDQVKDFIDKKSGK